MVLRACCMYVGFLHRVRQSQMIVYLSVPRRRVVAARHAASRLALGALCLSRVRCLLLVLPARDGILQYT